MISEFNIVVNSYSILEKQLGTIASILYPNGKLSVSPAGLRWWNDGSDSNEGIPTRKQLAVIRRNYNDPKDKESIPCKDWEGSVRATMNLFKLNECNESTILRTLKKDSPYAGGDGSFGIGYGLQLYSDCHDSLVVYYSSIYYGK